jgi:hypothetical protein
MFTQARARIGGARSSNAKGQWVALFAAVALAACGGGTSEQPNAASSGNDTAGMNGGPSGSEAGSGAPSGNAGTGTNSGTAGDEGGNAGGGDNPGNDPGPAAGTGSTAGSGGNGIDPEIMEMLDPDVDWTALTIIYPSMYSAFDGSHTFMVPAHVQDTEIELSGWTAIPSTAVTFDADPDVAGGVMITIVEPVEDIVIAASSGPIGGTAPLHVTIATPEQWAAGEARYANGVDYELPMLNFADLINPDWEPPPTPDNLACNNCHTTGAKYFEIQHTPTQAARLSDEDLKTIMTTGMKPPGVDYRVLPEMLQHLYAEFHTWEANDDELTGLIVYLRSLTPTGQGDILLPDGTFGMP